MTFPVYLQVFLQAFVTAGGALVSLASMYVCQQEWSRHNRALGCLWAFLSLAGFGIVMAAGPFLLDSIPTPQGLSYMAGAHAFDTFSMARYAWAAYAAGTLWHIWHYAGRAMWFGLSVTLIMMAFCSWILWTVWELHG